MGDSDDVCSVGIHTQIRLGDRDANVICMDASVCLNYDAWVVTGFQNLDFNDVGSQLAVANGYHGSPRDDQHGVQEIGDFAYYARVDGLGDDWVDIMYTYRSGSNDDDCAVTVVFAQNVAEANDAYDYSGLTDFHSTGSHLGPYYYSISGCDPSSGAPL
jgi:hypothetical protein